MRRLQLAGHSPLGLVGGSTGLIGDPRPTAERTLNTRTPLRTGSAGCGRRSSRFLSFEGDNAARMVNNLDWTAPLSRHRLPARHRQALPRRHHAAQGRRRLAAESDEGISYTEFSYQILQGMDFLQLYRDYGCTLQTGGSGPVGQPHQRYRTDP